MQRDAAERTTLAGYLREKDYQVTETDSSTAFCRAVEHELPDVALLDFALSHEECIALLRHLRIRSARVGVITIAAAGDATGRIIGLEAGSDDCVSKPIELRELSARIRSVLRRSGAAAIAPNLVRIGCRVLDTHRHVLLDDKGTEEPLAASEFDLLRLLIENPNRPLARDWLTKRSCHREPKSFDRAIDLRITRLRRKVELDPAHPEAIRTVRGVGYMFVPMTD